MPDGLCWCMHDHACCPGSSRPYSPWAQLCHDGWLHSIPKFQVFQGGGTHVFSAAITAAAAASGWWACMHVCAHNKRIASCLRDQQCILVLQAQSFLEPDSSGVLCGIWQPCRIPFPAHRLLVPQVGAWWSAIISEFFVSTTAVNCFISQALWVLCISCLYHR